MQARLVLGAVNITFTGMPVTFRLDYIHGQAGASALQLSWNGTLVPAAALSTTVTPYETTRAEMKDAMQCPIVPWQTFNNPSMGTHVLMPSSFAMDTTLAFTAGPHAGHILGDLIVFRQSNPAITHVGHHSYNGSDYTVCSWPRGCILCSPPSQALLDISCDNV